MNNLKQIEKEAISARSAVRNLNEEAVSSALLTAAARTTEKQKIILESNEADYRSAKGRLDEGTLDRLRLDSTRIEALAKQLEEMASIPPLDRNGQSWELSNGLRVTERRIPIGVVGANFEARPNVALDIAAQLLKSLNAVVLRTGSAALGTVTTLVDDILRPSLEEVGIPPGAVGLIRSHDREGARLLVSLPNLIPLVILRGSGQSTSLLARAAAENGVRALAHAEGGGVLYLHESADSSMAIRLIEQSLDRLGVCNRLNLLIVDTGAAKLVPEITSCLTHLGVDIRITEQAEALGISGNPLDKKIGHEWANDPDRIATVTLHVVSDISEAARIANEETSGLAATIVANNPDAAEEFLNSYRGTTALWNATTRFTDGYALTGSPETGINVDWSPGPRGPVTYRDLWLRQYRVIGDGSQSR